MRLFLTIAILCWFYNGAYGKDSLDIEMKLKTLNKPALKTIKSEDGDIIDCVDIYKQHAFDHPALRDHKILMKPSVEFDSKKTNIPNNSSSEPVIFQTWSKSGECPTGTIPVRRVSKEDLSRASSLSRFGKKKTRSYSYLDNAIQRKANFNLTAASVGQPTTKEISVCKVQGGDRSDPRVQLYWRSSRYKCLEPSQSSSGEYSSSQIWLVNGPKDSFETVEAGWLVYPSLYNDSRARLFTYWTRDGYINTGCFDLLCAGFVQTTTKFALGAAIEPVSTPGSAQYAIPLSIILDQRGDWWLTCSNIHVGYWPGELFHGLKRNAIAVQWGGEVHSRNVKKSPHTRAAMGSGKFAYDRFGNACFQTNLRIKDYSMSIKYPEYLSLIVDEPECYNTMLYRETYMSEPMFYFGGPGQNYRCP